MTCRDLMTRNVAVCVASDSAARAAQLMKDENVGPIPVVSDHVSRKLVGIVTDRDLTLKIVAESKDPMLTQLNEVMTKNPVTCHPEDSLARALDQMTSNQVRRLPVVDGSGQLLGIIAQADVALRVDEGQVGEMVEQISQPGRHSGVTGWLGPVNLDSKGDFALRAAMIVGSIGMGAAIMYLLDPKSGSNRREDLREKVTHLPERLGRQPANPERPPLY